MKPVQNPPNPFTSADYHFFEETVPPAKLEIYEDQTRTILAHNDSPDLGFRWSINPYRGCTHACAYCYARPSHEYLGFGSGTDFETKILIKKRAPSLLREAFMKKNWKGELIVFSGDTDCYQPLEASYRLTRGLLETCLEFGNPAGIITKSFLITRDIDLLRALHERAELWVSVSIPFWDEKTARIVEPGAASVQKRFEAVKLLSDAGISVDVLLAPIIPGLNDSDIPQILKEARKAGAKWASPVLLRLPGNVKEVFLTRIRNHFPLASEKIIGRIRQVRGGALYQSEFGKRFSGEGEYWENLMRMFQVQRDKLRFPGHGDAPVRPAFKRPTPQAEFIF